eukprot:CAMPEP_0170500508 /NCGR_PEP_ID=MMETSP0208-20121228/35108_1 /TAXON_ID=197538 /ORGANISM="Strombidium inclinatum, Strain S3" /LENGTH=48 /DNA_ID= /DNA_START= /DNA_END= /DNA_ORIENTATION=
MANSFKDQKVAAEEELKKESEVFRKKEKAWRKKDRLQGQASGGQADTH